MSDEKTVDIIVNGRQKTVAKGELSFDEIVNLAFDNPPTGDGVIFTVTYRRSEGNKEASLTKGESVKIKEGMVFSVTPTGRS